LTQLNWDFASFDAKMGSLTTESEMECWIRRRSEAMARRVGGTSGCLSHVAVVPPGTAWYRVGPDKFFSPRRKGEEITAKQPKWEGIEDKDENEEDDGTMRDYPVGSGIMRLLKRDYPVGESAANRVIPRKDVFFVFGRGANPVSTSGWTSGRATGFPPGRRWSVHWPRRFPRQSPCRGTRAGNASPARRVSPA
jgi:hypothetical protein